MAAIHNDAELRAQLGIGLVAQTEGNIARAISAFERALAVAPDHPEALYLLGATLFNDGRAADAVDPLERAARKLRNQPAITGCLAHAYFALGRFADAQRAFRNASRLEPGNIQFQLGTAAALAMQRQFTDAEALLRRLSARYPQQPLVWFNLGNILRDQGDLEKAVDSYRAAIALDAGLIDARNNLANALQSLHRLDDAAGELRTCLALSPGFVLAKCNLASVIIDQGRFTEAENICLEAIEQAPDFGLAHALLGIARSRQGRLTDALACQQAAVHLAPNDPKVLEAYAALLADLGHYSEAMLWFTRALKSNPGLFSARWKLCLALLRHGDLATGWLYYGQRPHPAGLRKYGAIGGSSIAVPSSPNAKRICIIQEQGLGDEVFFLRFLPQLRARNARIAVRVSHKLKSLIERVQCVDQVLEHDAEPAPEDLTVLAGDLPRVLALEPASLLPSASTENFSQLPRFREKISIFWPQLPPPLALTPLPDRLREAEKRLVKFGPPPYLGITWRGGTTPGEQQGRPWMLYKEIPIPALAHALRAYSGTYVALQRNPAAGELQILEKALGRKVLDLTAQNEDLEEMLALLAVIDDYVCVSNTNVHLRAGLAKETRVLIPSPPDWRWMDAGRTSPWFPHCQVYRQCADGDWSPALARLESELSEGGQQQTATKQ